ncbi:hypothetical protein [Arsenicicoccus dermatophilus]|nr:hypothetical protein [Arsenicicoccus dermatophilus]MCH8613528.1 hypothetical protein [Arsenicicoccus dermatophilus]
MRLVTRIVTALAVAGLTLVAGGASAQAARSTDTVIRIEQSPDTLIRID